MPAEAQPKTLIDWSKCHLVESNPRIHAGRPVLVGTRMPADDIVDNYQAGVDEAEIAELFEISLQQVQDVLVYAATHDVASRPI